MVRQSLQLVPVLALTLLLLIVSCAPAAAPTATPSTAPAPTAAPAMEATAAPPTPTPAPTGEKARRGGTLLVGGGGIPQFAAWEQCCSAEAMRVNDSVLQYKPSEKFFGGDEEIEGRMAYEWTVAKDGLSWSFKLEPNMMAALPDGAFEPVDCDDVAWSIMTIKTGEGIMRTMRGRTFVPVTKVECPDPLTAVVHTKFPYAALPAMLAVSINPVLPKDYWQPRLKDLARTIVGSGPWKLERVVADEVTTYIPNPRYHRKAADGKPYPYLDRIEHQIGAGGACFSALRVGRVHICNAGSATQGVGIDTVYREAKHLQFIGPFRPEDNPEWNSKGQVGMGPQFLDAHKGKAPWTNVKLREALSLGVDRRTMCTIGMEGWCQPGNYVFNVGTPWNLPRKTVETYPGYNIDTVEQNIARARQILQEQGYALYPDPKALFVDMPGIPGPGDFDAVLTETLRRAGFNVKMYSPEFQRGTTQAVSGEFDVMRWNQIVSHPDPNQVCYEHYYTGSDRNYGRYSNPQADDLCNRMGQELDKTKRITLAHEFSKLILDDHARAQFDWYAFSYVMSPDIRGFKVSSNFIGGSAHRMDYWWLAK
ncbi:MAG: ABC transporter substrate-binding protein [Chloroflexi bacterium]|nr:ABC transporter substrate-binding protein [Chloroflexota bacterium]